MGIFDKLFRKTRAAPQAEVELCDQCGHDFNAHLVKASMDTPSEGWMECPVDGCECHRTWSLEQKADAD